jgi:hypothetical protein
MFKKKQLAFIGYLEKKFSVFFGLLLYYSSHIVEDRLAHSSPNIWVGQFQP